MEEYRGNSHKSREAAKTPTPPTPEKRVEKVVTKEVKLKQKSGVRKVVDMFIVEDVGTALSYAWSDIVVPASKKVVYDMITNVFDIIFYGANSRDRKSSSGSKVSYGRFYEKERDRDRDRRGSSEPRARNRFDYEDIVIASRGEAENVLIQMEELIERYNYVTVLDLYDMLDRTAPYTADRYGWTTIKNASVVRDRDGYLLNLPKAMPLD